MHRERRPTGVARWRSKLKYDEAIGARGRGRDTSLAGRERIEFWPIERLIPYAKNARLHTEADINKLVDSLRRWGWTNPVLVDEQGVLIFGHGRLRGSKTGADVDPGDHCPRLERGRKARLSLG